MDRLQYPRAALHAPQCESISRNIWNWFFDRLSSDSAACNESPHRRNVRRFVSIIELP